MAETCKDCERTARELCLKFMIRREIEPAIAEALHQAELRGQAEEFERANKAGQRNMEQLSERVRTETLAAAIAWVDEQCRYGLDAPITPKHIRDGLRELQPAADVLEHYARRYAMDVLVKGKLSCGHPLVMMTQATADGDQSAPECSVCVEKREVAGRVREACAAQVANLKGGYSASLEFDGLLPDADGPWILNSDGAAEIRALDLSKLLEEKKR